MHPTLQEREVVFVNRLSFLFHTPQIGDIIAFRDPRDKKVLIKRITKRVKEKYFVEGDNKKHSTDSREFGMIGRNDIVGKVI